MSIRRILNKTSQKKRDTMAPLTDVVAGNPESGTFSQTAAVISGGTGQFFTFPWIATARDGNSTTGVNGTKIEAATRTSTTCFMRGLRENILIETNSGESWRWRRICFTMKGEGITEDDKDPADSHYFREASSGYTRLINQAPNENVIENVFKGSRDIDWVDVFTAQVDTSRVSIKYDRSRVIQSGNASGVSRMYKIWHPMNHNLVYNDDEIGAGEVTLPMSTESRAGMGDYYVVDFFQPTTGSSTTDQLAFLPNASLYWHEK